jgi:hypothetical protein
VRRGMSPPRSVRRGMSPPRSVRRSMSPPRTYDQTRSIPRPGPVGATRSSSHITRDVPDTLRTRQPSAILLDTVQPANGISSSGTRLATAPVLVCISLIDFLFNLLLILWSAFNSFQTTCVY